MEKVSVCLALLLLLSFCCDRVAANLNGDAEALLAFAGAVHHSRKLNWRKETEACSSWIGITCNEENSRVIRVRLPGIGLRGSIPPNSIGKLDALQILSLRWNALSGELPADVPSLPSLRALYLQHNNISGWLPLSFSQRLRTLDLSSNSLSGHIPPTIMTLSNLVSLNLANNSLSGSIPNLKPPNLRYFNISFNNLDGSVPSSLQCFPSLSFLGNFRLCGYPLSQCSAALLSPQLPSSDGKKLDVRIIAAIVSGGFTLAFLLSVAVVLFCIIKKKGRDSRKRENTLESSLERGEASEQCERNNWVFFDGFSCNFSLESLMRYSAEGSCEGMSYKAAIEDDSTTAVVKRLRDVVVGKKEFEQQMEIIPRVGHHPNILPLKAYYFSTDQKLLIYECTPNNTLSEFLHRNKNERGTALSSDCKIRIALEIANAIAHLHEQAGLKFVHGNIKSSNILITSDLQAIVTEHGISQLIPDHSVPSRMSAGYLAPESFETKVCTQEADVYAFGVMLLEMLTGKPPLYAPARFPETVIGVNSVDRQKKTLDIFDAELLNRPHIKGKMVEMLRIAVACTSEDPRDRPRMYHVVGMIADLRGID